MICREAMTLAAHPLRLQSTADEVVDTFDELGLNKDLLRGIFAYG